MNITYLPHTADIRMKIESSTVEQLFIAGMIGMGNILKEGFCDKDNPIDCKSKIEIQAMDQTCLLIDFYRRFYPILMPKNQFIARLNSRYLHPIE